MWAKSVQAKQDTSVGWDYPKSYKCMTSDLEILAVKQLSSDLKLYYMSTFWFWQYDQLNE